MRLRCWRTMWMTLAVTALASAFGAQGTAGAADIPDADMARIEAALPDRPTVQPRQERKLLIFSACQGFRHGSIPWGIAAVQSMGEKTGAWQSVVSDDIAMFRPENLAQFDAIVFNNSTGTLFEDPALKISLVEFVKSGKGIIGIHAATDCFYDWPEFGAMMGGYFDGHPWNEEVTIKIDDPKHPVNAAFEGEPLVVADEIYQFKDPYSRDALRVLLSLDTIRTNMAKRGIKRDDADFAVSWVRSYGAGRVFYCSLGHRNEIFWNPKVLRHYLDGIQFALGDLEADTTPSAQLIGPGGDVMPLEKALAAAAVYEFGASRLPLTAVAAHVRYALEHPAQRGPVVQGLLGVLESDGATVDGKAFVCRQLTLVGGDESVPALASLLPDARLSHMARYALQRIPREAAAAALRNALHATDGEVRIGVINSIGERRDRRAVGMLARIARADEPTMVATIAALGKIGGQEAFNLLAELSEDARAAGAKTAVLQALIPFAEDFARQRQPKRAAPIYRHLFAPENPRHIRVAGLRGLAQVEPMEVVSVVGGLLSDDDPQWRGTAARMVVDTPGVEVTTAFAGRLDVLPDEAQILMIEALAERGDAAAGPAVIAVISRAETPVRRAAVRALGELGEASTVALLASLAAAPDGDTVDDARASLDRLRAEGVDVAIVAVMEQGSPGVRCELARSLGARGAVAQAPALIGLAGQDGEATVRIAALQALGRLADEPHLPDLVRLLVGAASEEERDVAEDSLADACGRIDDVERRAAPVVSALEGADVPAKRSLLSVLGRLGGRTALDAVRAAVGDPETVIADTAVGALTEWPDAGAAPVLLAIAGQSPDPVHRESAFRGYIRVIRLPADRDPAETVRMHRQALEIAEGNEEIRLVLASLGDVNDASALALVEQYLPQRAVQSSAAASMISIARSLAKEQRAEALAAIDDVLAVCAGDEDMRVRAGEAVNHIERDEDFVTAWLFSGPYTKEKHDGGALFDVAFDPEMDGVQVAWRQMPAEAFSDPGIFDLNKVVNGSNCCGYVMTIIESEIEQEARIEMGSDDGLKAWLNGSVVHANNAMRGLTVGSDRGTVRLKPGANTLLLKITQGGGDWKVCCRIRRPDGFALEGMSFRSPH